MIALEIFCLGKGFVRGDMFYIWIYKFTFYLKKSLCMSIKTNSWLQDLSLGGQIQRKRQSLSSKVGIEFPVTWNSVFQVSSYDEQNKAQSMTVTFVNWFLWRILIFCRKKLLTWKFLSAKYNAAENSLKQQQKKKAFSGLLPELF